MKVDESRLSIWHPAAIISTVLSIGRIPYAPGTWGSLFGVLIFPVFLILPLRFSQLHHHHQKVNVIIFFTLATLLLLYLIGVIAIRKYQQLMAVTDASEIVYDELFGQILTFTLIAAFYVYWNMHVIGAKSNKVSLAHSLVYQFVPFLFFRLFDIIKPWPVSIIDRKMKGPHGVMLDDVLAGVFAAICSVIIFMLADSNFNF